VNERRPGEPVIREIGDENVLVRAHEHVSDAAGAVDDEADLPADLDRSFGESSGGLGCDDHARRHLSAVQPLEHPDFCGFEARYVTMHGRDGKLPHWSSVTILPQHMPQKISAGMYTRAGVLRMIFHCQSERQTSP
jgi:hypothetical protein